MLLMASRPKIFLTGVDSTNHSASGPADRCFTSSTTWSSVSSRSAERSAALCRQTNSGDNPYDADQLCGAKRADVSSPCPRAHGHLRTLARTSSYSIASPNRLRLASTQIGI